MEHLLAHQRPRLPEDTLQTKIKQRLAVVSETVLQAIKAIEKPKFLKGAIQDCMYLTSGAHACRMDE
jgi:hypothetical protein